MLRYHATAAIPEAARGGLRLKKETYFDRLRGRGWPQLSQLEPFFLSPPEKCWSYLGGNDNWGLSAKGVHDTEHLPFGRGRIDIELEMWGNPQLGVLIIYSKMGGGYKDVFTSKGDLNRLGELVRGLQDTPLPVGLFIPFDEAWKAVKEFIETNGELPKGIAWVANRDLPPNTFPDP